MRRRAGLQLSKRAPADARWGQTIVNSRMEQIPEPAEPASEASPRWRKLLQPRSIALVVSLLALLPALQAIGSLRTVAPASEGSSVLATSAVAAADEAPVEAEPAPALATDEDAEGAAPTITHRAPASEPVDQEAQPGGSATPAGVSDAAPVPPSDGDEPADVEALELEPISTQLPRIKLAEVSSTRDDGSRRLLGTSSSAAERENRAARDVVRQALNVPGVTFATSVEIGEVRLVTDGGVQTISVAAVDPEGFRVLTPQVTADSDGVWQRISEGDAAFTHDVGTRLELELGSRVRASAGNRSTLRVGAYASNGVPPVADAIISRATAAEIGLDGTRTLLVSIAEDADATEVAAALERATGMKPDVIEKPETQRAFLTGEAAREAFEPFSYVSIGDGMIQIDRDWVARNIVTAKVPILRGAVTCHRHLIPQLRGALQEIQDKGLSDLIDPSQYGGCWVPRHILFNPNRGISMHAWGLAVDLNVRGNEYGNTNPEMDPRVVEIFERWGFVWGGRWSTPDGMHFELGALLQDGSERG